MNLTKVQTRMFSFPRLDGQLSFRRKPLAVAVGLPGALLLAAAMHGAPAAAAPSWCGEPPCKGGPGGGGEPVGTNNLSYPVIWSDNVRTPGFVSSTNSWTFAEVTSPLSQCVQQDPPVGSVPAEVVCYYGQKNLGIDEETGDRIFEPPTKIWWLQQRQSLGNSWQVFNIADQDAEVAAGNGPSPVVVTGVDTGDLMESSITIKAKQIRTEFTLLKRVTGEAQLGSVTDTDYENYLVDYFGGTCILEDNDPLAPNNCLAAHNMSGAVPGTDQSIEEIQGSDFEYSGLGIGNLIDPRAVKTVRNYFDPTLTVITAEEPDPRIVLLDPVVGMDATVYSSCARLVIQPIDDPSATPIWSSDAGGGVASGTHGGYWTGGMGEPVVDLAAWDVGGAGVSGQYSAEINAGGSVIYGYNWNTKLLSAKGDYRVTFVLEGDTSHEGKCTNVLNTVFDGTTKSVNVGERRPAQVVSADDMGGHHGEGGLAYIDVVIGASGGGAASTSTGGGGAGGGGPRNKP